VLAQRSTRRRSRRIRSRWCTRRHLFVRDAFFGVRRFDDFQARLGISRDILNQRLTKLVDDGILERVPYQDNPPRANYRLTEQGRDLWHVLTAMRQWGDRWAAPKGPPLKMRHATCGRVVKAVATCSHCGEPLSLPSVTVEPGPGAVDADYERTALEGTSR